MTLSQSRLQFAQTALSTPVAGSYAFDHDLIATLETVILDSTLPYDLRLSAAMKLEDEVYGETPAPEGDEDRRVWFDQFVTDLQSVRVS